MAIIILDKDCVIDYVPELNDNRKEKKPIIIGTKPLMNDQFLDHLSDIESLKEEYPGDMKGLGLALKSLRRSRFINQVPYIKNCPKMLSDGSIGELTDPGELFDNQIALTVEIEEAMQIMSRLSEGQAKNFSGGSAGSEK